MAAQVKTELQHFVPAEVCAQYIDALALTSYFTLKTLSQAQIQAKFEAIGFGGNFPALLKLAMEHGAMGDAQVEQEYNLALQHMDTLIQTIVQNGVITDEFMDTLCIRGGEARADGKGIKSQRAMLLSHPRVRAAALELLSKKVQAAELSARRVAQKSVTAAHLVSAPPGNGERRPAVTQYVKNRLRAESEAQRASGSFGVGCARCAMVHSVFERHKYKTAMWFCSSCSQYYCSFCAGNELSQFLSSHAHTCSPESTSDSST
jgi:hypothetical protein